MSVWITEKRLNPAFIDRGLLTFHNRLDVFKYSLASLAAINFNKAYLYIELDDEFTHRKDELAEFINDLYGDKAKIFWQRHTHQSHWKKSLEETVLLDGDDLIWFLCNDDHIFIDYDMRALSETEELMLQDNSQYICCYFTHFPEIIKFAKMQNAEKNNNHLVYNWQIIDSAQLVNKSFFKSMWFDFDYGNKFLPRSDHAEKASCHPAKYYLPLREMVRHYDGYYHVGIKNSECPALTIPPGFFERKIKIRFGYEENLPDWVNVNPLKTEYSAVNKDGADYRCLIEDLPLFWKERIVQVDINRNLNLVECIKGRNQAYRQIACAIPNKSGWDKHIGDPRVEHVEESWLKPLMR